MWMWMKGMYVGKYCINMQNTNAKEVSKNAIFWLHVASMTSRGVLQKQQQCTCRWVAWFNPTLSRETGRLVIDNTYYRRTGGKGRKYHGRKWEMVAGMTRGMHVTKQVHFWRSWKPRVLDREFRRTAMRLPRVWRWSWCELPPGQGRDGLTSDSARPCCSSGGMYGHVMACMKMLGCTWRCVSSFQVLIGIGTPVGLLLALWCSSA